VTAPTIAARAGGALGLRPRSHAAVGYLAAGAAVIAVYFVLPGDAQSVVYVLLGLSAVCAILVGASRNPVGDRLPWYLFAGGIFLQAAGDAVFGYYEIWLNREPPTPSAADVLYLAGYPLLAAGAFLLLRRLGGATSRAALLDTVIVGIALGVVQWIFVVDPYEHKTLGGGEQIVLMAYPALGMLLLVALAQLVVGRAGRTPTYRLLIAGLVLWVVADELFAIAPDAYAGGSWTDALWLGAYVVWGCAALESAAAPRVQPDRRAVPRLTTPRLILLTGALLTPPVVMLIERLAHHDVHVVVVAVGSTAIAILVLVRLAGLVRAVDGARQAERYARRDAEFAQRLLVDQNEQLRELDRVKDEFLSSVSHELRTPLTSISGYLELLLEDVEEPVSRGHLQVVSRNAERLLALVNDLLFAARLGSGRLELDLEPVDLRALVRDSVEAARPRAETAQVRLVVTDASVPPVSGERVRLEQLVDNLVSNAIKFTPSGGEVAIGLGPVNGTVRLEVSDTGIGISETERAHLFERFFRSQAALDQQIQGTGLGLYISKAIVDAHGGRIAVRSEQGAGTTFIVELPAGA
jgi:signal transduction histidine kinase